MIILNCEMVRNELFHKNINVGLWLGPKGVKLLNPYFQSTVIYRKLEAKDKSEECNSSMNAIHAEFRILVIEEANENFKG